MKKFFCFVLLALVVLLIYMALRGGLWEDKDKRGGFITRMVHETVEAGRSIGRKGSKAFESVGFGREK